MFKLLSCILISISCLITTLGNSSTVFVATAYSIREKTASGEYTRRGIIAADNRILPMHSKVKLDAGSYSGNYVVKDTGGAIRGRRIDIWLNSTREALRFGRRKVKLTVLTYGSKISKVRRSRYASTN